MEASGNEWEALETLLAANAGRSHQDALSDRDLVALVIEFVSAPTLPGFLKLLARNPMGGLRFEPKSEALRAGMTPEKATVIANNAIADETAADRAQTRDDLQAVIDRSVSPQAIARLAASASQQALLPVFDFNNDGLVIRYRYRVSSLSAVFAFAVLLLLDKKSGFGKNFCRCKWQECGKFFLADRTTGGRPRTEYCETAHMKLQHEADGAGRAADSRKERAAATKAKARRAKQHK